MVAGRKSGYYDYIDVETIKDLKIVNGGSEYRPDGDWLLVIPTHTRPFMYNDMVSKIQYGDDRRMMNVSLDPNNKRYDIIDVEPDFLFDAGRGMSKEMSNAIDYLEFFINAFANSNHYLEYLDEFNDLRAKSVRYSGQMKAEIEATLGRTYSAQDELSLIERATESQVWMRQLNKELGNLYANYYKIRVIYKHVMDGTREILEDIWNESTPEIKSDIERFVLKRYHTVRDNRRHYQEKQMNQRLD